MRLCVGWGWVEEVSEWIKSYLEQVQAIFVQSRHYLREWFAFVVLKLLTFPTFPLRKVLHTRPIFAIRCTYYLKDAFQFISLLLPRKQRPHVHHLREDTPNRPNINRTRVLLRSKQDIRRSIPKRNNFMRESLNRDAGCPCQSKICDLEYVILRDQQILWFEISMQYFFLMAMGDTFDELIGETLDYKRIHALLFAKIVHELLEVVLQILED